VAWRKWTLMFIDIAWMWISNIKENREKIVKAFWSTNISLEEKQKKLLEAGLDMTQKIISLSSDLAKLWAKISIGWDELFMFIPENKKQNFSKAKIAAIFEKNWLKARATYMTISWKKELEKKEVFDYFDKLDEISKVNKKVENAWKFFIAKGEEKEKLDKQIREENYKDIWEKILTKSSELEKIKNKAKNISKENKNLKYKQEKNINFFKVPQDELEAADKEQIIKEIKWKIISILEKKYFDILSVKNNF
jgi:hypothetical protein